MVNIESIINSMAALDGKKEEESALLMKINELQKKREVIIKELPTLDEELKIWQKELSELEGKPGMEDDIQTWNSEISKIQSKIRKKEKEIKVNENTLNKLIKNQKEINNEYINLRSDIKNFILKILKNKKDIKDYSKDEIIILTKILKKILDPNNELKIDSFLDLIANEGIEITLNYLELINTVFGEKLNIIPEIVTKFIADYLTDLKTDGNLVDPWPLNGFMLKNLNSEVINKDVITVNQRNKIFKTSFNDLNNHSVQNIHELKFDFIVGYPPLEYSSEINKDIVDAGITDDNSFINFLDAAFQLNDTGVGIFILKKDFLLNRAPNTVFSNLNQYGLYVKAIIEIPNYVLSEESEKILVIICRTASKDVFVGSISTDFNSNKVLKENLIQNKIGKIPQLGYILPLDSFYTFKSLYAHIETLEINKDLTLSTSPLSTIVKELNLPLKTIKYDDKPNSIYIPLDNTLKVEINPEKTTNSDYIQVVLDQENSLAEYFVNYLNDTLLGSKIRESMNLDIYPEASYHDIIVNTEFHIPDLNTQVEILRIDSQINEIAARAASYRKLLWKKPDEYQSIIREIESLDDKSDYQFERWIETLPFPLASILWESLSTSKPDLKVKYLLQFFEALSEFNVLLILSGLIKNERFFNREFYRCTQYNPKFKNWFYSPSFGNWNFFGQCLGRNIQYILRKQYKRNQLLDIFGNAELDFLNIISSYELSEILSEVNKYRNSWEAHGPVVSPPKYENRFKILRNSISKLYNCFGNIFENNILVLPLNNTYSEGIYHYTVKKFMGSRNRFKSIEVNTRTPMDAENIYLLMGNRQKPIELLPLIKFYKNTCYFYNSSVKDEFKSQFVSYHNKESPEIFCPVERLDDFYSIFEREDYRRY